PRRERDVGSDSGRLAQGQREGQRHSAGSIRAPRQSSLRKRFDWSLYFWVEISSRTSRLPGVSPVATCLPHTANVSTPCKVISAGVRWPSGVPSSTARWVGPRSADERRNGFCTATSLSVRASATPSSQLLKRARSASASWRRASATLGG